MGFPHVGQCQTLQLQVDTTLTMGGKGEPLDVTHVFQKTSQGSCEIGIFYFILILQMRVRLSWFR